MPYLKGIRMRDGTEAGTSRLSTGSEMKPKFGNCSADMPLRIWARRHVRCGRRLRKPTTLWRPGCEQRNGARYPNYAKKNHFSRSQTPRDREPLGATEPPGDVPSLRTLNSNS